MLYADIGNFIYCIMLCRIKKVTRERWSSSIIGLVLRDLFSQRPQDQSITRTGCCRSVRHVMQLTSHPAPFPYNPLPEKKLMVNGHAHPQMSMFNLLHKMIVSQLYSQQFHIIISDTIITIPQRPQYIRNELFHNRSSRRNLKGFIIEPALVDGGDEQLISLRHHCDMIVVAGGETPACVWHLTGLYSDDYENSSSITSLEEKEKPPLIIKDPIENTSVKNIK